MKAPCNPPEGCHRCGGQRPPRRRAYCSQECSDLHARDHYWNLAKWWALRRSGGECEDCPDPTTASEVHHIVLLPHSGYYAQVSCYHHSSNLRALCIPCHKATHKALRAVEKMGHTPLQ